ncbi:hypothetical protein [Pelovirga terrestris]|uniref:Uncharacterized protein n=1 Tax=Pelovirga terrestris TaxID=2771352 RepID=A0A8J6UGB0_9BACT|nr:hypothetical protein [Pelovirga terrestris]
MQKDHLEVILESIDSKFNLVLEGHDALRREIREEAEKNEERFKLLDFKVDTVNDHLSKKIDAVAADLNATDKRLNNKIDSVEERLTKKIDAVTADLKITDAKVDGVAADLKAHRADTEAHGNIYRVKEG